MGYVACKKLWKIQEDDDGGSVLFCFYYIFKFQVGELLLGYLAYYIVKCNFEKNSFLVLESQKSMLLNFILNW